MDGGAVAQEQQARLNDYLAVERTSLAWIRTGLALMGFGFVVARFGLFLQQIEIVQQRTSPAVSSGLSLWFGTALIAVGVLINGYSAWHHASLIRRLQRGESLRVHPWIQTTLVGVLLVIVGAAMAVYLVWIRHPMR
jgi:putative membrane protein